MRGAVRCFGTCRRPSLKLCSGMPNGTSAGSTERPASITTLTVCTLMRGYPARVLSGRCRKRHAVCVCHYRNPRTLHATEPKNAAQHRGANVRWVRRGADGLAAHSALNAAAGRQPLWHKGSLFRMGSPIRPPGAPRRRRGPPANAPMRAKRPEKTAAGPADAGPGWPRDKGRCTGRPGAARATSLRWTCSDSRFLSVCSRRAPRPTECAPYRKFGTNV